MKTDKWGLDLLSRLLLFRPSERLPLTEALDHAYFRGAYISEVDGSEHPTATDLYLHDLAVTQHMYSSSSSQSSASHTIQPLPLTPLASSCSSLTIDREAACKLGMSMIPYDNKALTSVEDAAVSLWFECASSSISTSSPSSLQTLVATTDSLMLDVYDPTSSSSVNSNVEFWSLSTHVQRDEESGRTCASVFLDLIPTTGDNNSNNTSASDVIDDDGNSSNSKSRNSNHNDLPVHFKCPKCGRQFDAYDSCAHHALVRKHSQRCHTYYTHTLPVPRKVNDGNNNDDDDTTLKLAVTVAVNESTKMSMSMSLPSALQCLSTESLSHTLLQPLDPDSGWCDLLGRRRVMEDRHSMSHEEEYSYYAVHDGHFGSRTARIMARNHHSVFRNQLLQSLKSTRHTSQDINKTATMMDTNEIHDLHQFNFTNMKQSTRHIFYTANPNSRSHIDSNFNWNRDVLDNMIGADFSPDDVIYNHIDTRAQIYASNGKYDGMAWTLQSVVAALHYSYLVMDDHLITRDQHSAPSTPTPTPANEETNRKRKHKHGSREDTDTNVNKDDSGTTTAAVLVFPHHLVISNLGDSRVVLCCDSAGRGLPVQLTLDHTPYVLEERNRVIHQGGFITNDIYVHTSTPSSLSAPRATKLKSTSASTSASAGIPRVNGVLAVTRSIGDRRLKPWVSAESDIIVLRRDRGIALNNTSSSASHTTSAENKINPFSACQKYQNMMTSTGTPTSRHRRQLFLILASDGLWDAVGNEDAVDIVCEHLLLSKANSIDSDIADIDGEKQMPSQSMTVYQEVAELLSREAYLRGSSDNIGTCVVNLLK